MATPKSGDQFTRQFWYAVGYVTRMLCEFGPTVQLKSCWGNIFLCEFFYECPVLAVSHIRLAYRIFPHLDRPFNYKLYLLKLAFWNSPLLLANPHWNGKIIWLEHRIIQRHSQQWRNLRFRQHCRWVSLCWCTSGCLMRSVWQQPHWRIINCRVTTVEVFSSQCRGNRPQWMTFGSVALTPGYPDQYVTNVCWIHNEVFVHVSYKLRFSRNPLQPHFFFLPYEETWCNEWHVPH